MLEYMRCPREIIDKAPSAGLYDGQTDEIEMGITYNANLMNTLEMVELKTMRKLKKRKWLQNIKKYANNI